MDDKILISQALYELAKTSETIFLEIGKEDKEIIEAAKKIGIELPSPDLIIMKTVYAEIDKVNLNGVVLPKKAVEKGINTLIGKQCNWEHNGAGYVCGFTIAAKINKDRIETINVLFKSLFPEQVDELISKVKTKEAAVSFEIWKIDPETKKSVVKTLSNGVKEISPIICHGTGVLLIHPPACPNAKIFQVVAKEEVHFFDELCFATLAIEKSKCKNCGNCKNHKEVLKVNLTELFSKITKEEDVNFESAMAYYYATEEEQKTITEEAAKWTRKFINNLPDSAFAVIEPAYPEKTQDKNARHLPHHNGEGDLGKEKSNANLDLPHYKNALARVNQINPISDSISAEELRSSASTHLERHKDALEKAEEQKKEPEKKEEKAQKLCPECNEPIKDDEELCAKCKEKKSQATILPETKAGEKVEETKTQVAETKSTDSKVEETKEEKAQEEQVTEPKVVVKVTKIYSEVRVDTYVNGTSSGTEEVKGYNKKITEYQDGTKDEVTEEVNVKKTYDISEVEQKVNEVKVEMQKKIDEKETEIATLKQQIEQKTQEVASLTAKKEENIPSKPEVDLGAETPQKEEDAQIKRQANEINEIIASKHKNRS